MKIYAKFLIWLNNKLSIGYIKRNDEQAWRVHLLWVRFYNEPRLKSLLEYIQHDGTVFDLNQVECAIRSELYSGDSIIGLSAYQIIQMDAYCRTHGFKPKTELDK